MWHGFRKSSLICGLQKARKIVREYWPWSHPRRIMLVTAILTTCWYAWLGGNTSNAWAVRVLVIWSVTTWNIMVLAQTISSWWGITTVNAFESDTYISCKVLQNWVARGESEIIKFIYVWMSAFLFLCFATHIFAIFLYYLKLHKTSS